MGARILAVDDEEGILRLLKRVLERDGNVVYTVSDPEQLLNGEKGTGQYDLIRGLPTIAASPSESGNFEPEETHIFAGKTVRRNMR